MDRLGDLVGGLLGDLPRPWIRAGPRSDPGELQSVVCILQSRTALVCLAWLVVRVAAAHNATTQNLFHSAAARMTLFSYLVFGGLPTSESIISVNYPSILKILVPIFLQIS